MEKEGDPGHHDEKGRKSVGQGCGICYCACGWRCHRDLKDCCRLLTIRRGAIFAGRAQVSGAIARSIAAVRSGAACIVRDSIARDFEVDGETAKYTNSPATVGGKGVSHSMQSGRRRLVLQQRDVARTAIGVLALD
jgi:hypothetical protein